MTFPTMFQACNVYKSCKRKHSIAYGNYSGSARLTCDYKAILAQLQLQLPTGTELGNRKDCKKKYMRKPSKNRWKRKKDKS